MVLTLTDSTETIQEHKEDMSQERLNIKDLRQEVTKKNLDNLRSSFIEESRGKIMSGLEHAHEQQQQIEEEKLKQI